jgi:peroxiredoxin
MEKDATIYCDMMDRMSNLKMRSRLDESKVDEIARLLDTYKDQFSTPVFQREIAGRCNRSPSLTEYERQRARTFAALLDRPAPEWKLPDLEGATHKLADYRDKVVVLDFWSLSCDWGSHAMSQMNELCAAVKDMPVAVLGIYKGNDREDAELVADKMKLAYPTLMGTEIKNNYGVSGGSTVVVIDQHGVLRKLHFGSSPTLKQELLEDINSLLN